MTERKNNVLDYALPQGGPKSKPVCIWAAASVLLPEVAMLVIMFFEPLQILSVSIDNQFPRLITISFKAAIHILLPAFGVAAGVKGIVCVWRSEDLRGIGVAVIGIMINLLWIAVALLVLRGAYRAY